MLYIVFYLFPVDDIPLRFQACDRRGYLPPRIGSVLTILLENSLIYRFPL